MIFINSMKHIFQSNESICESNLGEGAEGYCEGAEEQAQFHYFNRKQMRGILQTNR